MVARGATNPHKPHIVNRNTPAIIHLKEPTPQNIVNKEGAAIMWKASTKTEMQ